MYILGISAYYHDSASCLVDDGKIVAAAQEERFSRKKHDERFPQRAIKYCLSEGGIEINDVDYVVFYEKPFLKFERLLETYLSFAPRGIVSFLRAMPIWLKQKLWMKAHIARELGYNGQLLFSEHHESHAASAFFPSPFKDAAIIVMDGVGEWATTSYGVGCDNTINLLEEVNFPHSLGLLYSSFTYYAGFKVNSGEYKLMGLAPYGKATYKQLILNEIIDIKEDGSFHLNMKYFDYTTGLRMINKKFEKLFGGPPRKTETMLTQKEMDIARSIQEVVEDVILRVAKHVRKKTGMRNLCLAGGVALNCVSNGRLLRERIFDNIWIQPASGDAGGALGSALLAFYQYCDKPRVAPKVDGQNGSYLGPSFTDEYIGEFLEKNNIPYSYIQNEDEFIDVVVKHIASGSVIGWFQQRMEFGPRALGNRSILGDARSQKMQGVMNLKIKFRESFRPFAPSVPMDDVSDYFELSTPSPYMLIVADVVNKRRTLLPEDYDNMDIITKVNYPRSDIPAVTHVDYSSRVQTVHENTNSLYHKLLVRFRDRHGYSVIVNTSFNVRGEPIVCTPEDAYRCFMRTNMDYLVVGKYIIDKKTQPSFCDVPDWEKEFELD